jgi:hypothetical protein
LMLHKIKNILYFKLFVNIFILKKKNEKVFLLSGVPMNVVIGDKKK